MADNVVHISEQSRERYSDCIKAIEAARAWVRDPASYPDLEYEEQMRQVRERGVAEMERSFLSNVARLFFTPASDGMLTIHTDMAPLSFFWRYESGYHGGLIFHLSHFDARDGTPPVGTWSVHT